jgi:hypothetical protein
MRMLIAVPLIICATSASAEIKTAECRTDLRDCYEQMDRSCRGNYRVIDRNQFYGDILLRELPGPSPYNSYVYECRG